jgi:phospholipid/cholesterol/gamma-HCH transport system permease protein
LTISLLETLDQGNATLLISELHNLLNQQRPKALVVDLKEIHSLDDFGVAVLVGLKREMNSRRGSFSLANISKEAEEILSLHQFNLLGMEDGVVRRRQEDIFSQLGGAVLDGLDEVSGMLSFLGDTCLNTVKVLLKPSILRYNDVLTNMQRVGVDALPIVGLISFLLGLIMAFMSSVQLQQFGANIYVASLVGLSMTRELGPIMTAIIVAGRSGSAFAAEIGTMKISEEIDALFTMGIDPHLFLVLPRLVAACLVVPVLTLFSDVFAIAGGLLVGVSMLDLTISGYMTQTINTLSMFDVFWGVFKSLVFAILIAWTGCLRGFQVRGGAAGVGRATTSAVVSGIFLIILFDSILVVILRYWEG